MFQPLPDVHDTVLAACAAGGWAVTRYSGSRPARTRRHGYTGLVALRGDLRAHAEWECALLAPPGRWLTSHAELAVRHPGHDTTDFARPAPERWQRPATADLDRRCRLAGIYFLARVLDKPDEVLIPALLARARGHRHNCGSR